MKFFRCTRPTNRHVAIWETGITVTLYSKEIGIRCVSNLKRKICRSVSSLNKQPIPTISTCVYNAPSPLVDGIKLYKKSIISSNSPNPKSTLNLHRLVRTVERHDVVSCPPYTSSKMYFGVTVGCASICITV